MKHITNKQLSALLRDIADNVEKIGEASKAERQKRQIQLRRLEPIFQEEFVLSDKEAARLHHDAAAEAWSKPKKTA